MILSRGLALRRRLIAPAVGIATLCAMVVAAASPAWAAYPIRYTLKNDTNQTLHLLSARVMDFHHCLKGCHHVPAHTFREISPHTVAPGGTAVLKSELNFTTFRQDKTIDVVFGIGPDAQYGRFELKTDPYMARCYTHNARPPNDRHYHCTEPRLRTFELK